MELYSHKNIFDYPPSLGFTNGLYEIDFKRYLSLRLCDYSFLKDFSITPAHGIAYLKKDKTISPIQQAAFDFGSAAHMAIFEKKRFAESFIPDLNKNKNSNEYKEWKKRIPDGVIALPQKRIDDLYRMMDIVSNKGFLSDAVTAPGLTEISGIFQNITYPSVWHKIRIDKLLTDDRILIDYKTSSGRIDRFAWEQTMRRYKYDWQAALYCHGVTTITGVNHKHFVWIIQESVPPFECRVEAADPSEMHDALGYIQDNVETLAECMESNYYPGYILPDSWGDVFDDGAYEINQFNEMEDGLSWM